MDKELKLFGNGLENVEDFPAYAQLAAVHVLVLQELAKVERAKSDSTPQAETGLPPTSWSEPLMGEWCGETVRVARHYKNKLSAKKQEYLHWRAGRLYVESKNEMLQVVDKENSVVVKGSLFNLKMNLWSSVDQKRAEDACLAGGKTSLIVKLVRDVDDMLDAMNKVIVSSSSS